MFELIAIAVAGLAGKVINETNGGDPPEVEPPEYFVIPLLAMPVGWALCALYIWLTL
ncbi:MAG: hypothetical protein LBC20_04690 [Planctomycetaceae bacterium]|jgi:hypothetical protein|nr:hypothetical protein [Planctomycetaceae bacterium]